MRRRPHLPPEMRGWPALRLTAAAAEGRLRLPVCRGCDHVTYPPAEVCGACLGDDLHWREVGGDGTVIAPTTLHRSLLRHFEDRLPHGIALVQLDAGPVVIVNLTERTTQAGARVRVLNRLDASGQGVLYATNETGEASMDTPNTEIAGKTVLITGAGGGIGRALTAAFAEAGAARIYAAVRDAASLSDLSDDRVMPLSLDVTSDAAFNDAPGDIDILVNNAGVNFNTGLLDADDMAAAMEEMAVNYFGVLRTVRAFAPQMKARNGGIIVNMATVLAYANLPLMGSYCASKAALLSLTQGVRAELMPWGVRVVGIFPGAVDTRMTVDFPPPKMSPAAAAAAVIGAIRDNLEDCYPGDMATALREKWREEPKAVERELAVSLPEPR